MSRVAILAVGAHPDDIEFGCGGSLAKYAAKGHRLFLLVLTPGEQGAAARLLGVEEVFWGGFADTSLTVSVALIQRIESVIAAVRPEFIFCHYPDDTHQDHRHLAQAVLSATRYIRNVLFYEGPTTQNFNPQVYVDISETLEAKLAALEAHRSQVMKTNIENLSILEMARSFANFRGSQGRVKYAEAFHAQRLFINIG